MTEQVSSPPAVSTHVRAFITWVAVYPTITIALMALQPWIGGLAVPVQTLVLTVLVVPLAAYGIVPPLIRIAVAAQPKRKAS
ncbi:MAG: hypothetical protein GX610_12560 [Rhodococcus sp.]|nr:hypothetical protein [Rhodococcus sp. (in: high G+C Gram-positive bacteria)]